MYCDWCQSEFVDDVYHKGACSQCGAPKPRQRTGWDSSYEGARFPKWPGQMGDAWIDGITTGNGPMVCSTTSPMNFSDTSSPVGKEYTRILGQSPWMDLADEVINDPLILGSGITKAARDIWKKWSK